MIGVGSSVVWRNVVFSFRIFYGFEVKGSIFVVGFFFRIYGCVGVIRYIRYSAVVGAFRLVFDVFIFIRFFGFKYVIYRFSLDMWGRCKGRFGGVRSYMYFETGALEMVWAGGCRLVWLFRSLL